MRETAAKEEYTAEWDPLSKQYAKFIAKRNETPLGILKHIKNKSTLEMVQEAALSIPPILFQCGIFAREFRDRLVKIASISKDTLKFETKHMKINLGSQSTHNSSIYYAGKDLDYNGLKIGYDNHIFTVVSINGASYIFDNVNQSGVSIDEFRRATILVHGNKVLGNLAGAPESVLIRDYDPYSMNFIGIAKKKVAAPKAVSSNSDFKAFLAKKKEDSANSKSAQAPKPPAVTTTVAPTATATSTSPPPPSNNPTN